MTVHSPRQRTAPFLHRTWLKGVQALQESSVMGSIISSSMHKVSHPADSDGTRPAKRRRLSSPDSFDTDRLIASPPMSESGSTLRIEVLKILHKDSKKVKSYQGAAGIPRDLVTSKARCRITIFDLSCGPPQVLHCQSQLCDLITFKNPVGPHRVARVDLSRAFYVPSDSILINRPDDGRFDLSDSYQLLVELEAARAASWPPLDSRDFGIPTTSPFSPWASSQPWVMSTRFDSVVGRLKHPLSLSTRSPSNPATFQTDYVMDVDLRWTAGFNAFRRPDKDSKPCITAIDPDVDPYRDANFEHVQDDDANGTNGHLIGDHGHLVGDNGHLVGDNGQLFGDNGHLFGESSHEQDDDFLHDQTPSRSLRTREKTKVYNLKVLSDQAQGRDHKRRGRSASATITEGRVHYLLPSDQPVCLDFFRCVSCGAYHESMMQLQLHLQTTHPTYEYVLETTSQGPPQFRVSAPRESFVSPIKTYQLGRQVKPFDLPTLAAGDLSWVTSRLGPENDEPFRLSPPRSLVDRLQSGSPVSRASKTATPRRTPKPKTSKTLVPVIAQPLFHPISKALLVPGQEVPETVPDDTWLIQKHQESIGDFSDVTVAEKEYIWQWDAYILRKNLTSVAYFPREWLGFVKEKAAWLVSEERRMLEFGKHSSVLLARDVLNDKAIKKAFFYIEDARAEMRRLGHGQSDAPWNPETTDVATKQSPKSSQIRKSASGCIVCQLPVLGPMLLVCSNTSCSKRLYHSTCIKKEAIMPVTGSKWLCNACCRIDGWGKKS
ncbi:Zinc finger domain-containing protein, PHD-finger [Ophiocordyceps sinensis CO18]|uniref:Zinc finger domain-containing protein, PHD-finger n=1 Tax=Ophiocordyceps sinensis (strain Co18 / CGMCC 3.14243) TaxID=911162 RepID=T5AFC0_OPHSC|nr:Zinc finger domain-containing protein, PHD-finger [Ophiocordyceps sinensis CO18]